MDSSTTGVQAMSVILMLASLILYGNIYRTRPHRRLMLVPAISWSLLGILFYFFVSSDILPTGSEEARFYSALLRLYEAVLVFGMAVILAWKPRR